MSVRIDPTSPITLTLPTEASGPVAGTSAQPGADAPSFGDLLAKMVDVADRADHAAAQKIDALARGASDDLHGTMIASKEADISVKLVGSIRNKLLDAFQEIWKTSV